MRSYHTDVPIDSRYSFVCARFQQLARDQLLQSEDDAVFASYANCCAAILYRLDCVFDLYWCER